MARPYHSPRRREAAEQTRRDILQAALRLHAEGVTEYEPLAQEAGCSVATVRKHFPTKEALFRDCTRTFAETLVLPDLAALGRIADRRRRLEAGIAELCHIHEAMFGYAWLCARQRGESPTLDRELDAYEGLADAVAARVTPPASAHTATVRGLLDFLTYRALRTSGGLSPEQAVAELTVIVRTLTHSGSR